MARLSKSRIMSSLQCLKKVHLEVHRKDLAQVSAATQAAFDIGHSVGAAAIQIYGAGEGQTIAYNGGDFAAAISQTRALLDGMFAEPIFEATLEHNEVLVREDVLLPDEGGWRIVEVKASTSLKPEYIQDCAIQAWVHEGAGYAFNRIALAHVDNQFVYPGEGNYQGLLIEHDLTETVRELMPSVPAWVERAKHAVNGPEPNVGVGQHCFTPYECPFVAHCWPSDSRYPLLGYKGSKKKLGRLAALGYRDIREVPVDQLDSEGHVRIRHVTISGEAEIQPEIGRFFRSLDWPRYYLDFETIGPPVPVWADTRPYQVLPFQWSCHIEQQDGKMSHAEFLDLSGEPPMRLCAEQLIRDLGDSGPILIYTTYEQGVIKGLVERFPDLAKALNEILERLVDIAPPVKQSYYHPDMLGSWSIKAVLPTIAPDMDYTLLEGIHEGTGASDAYLEAIKPETSEERREEIRAQLLKYCGHDTLAMVRLAHFFADT